MAHKSSEFDKISSSYLANEIALLSLGDFEPLNIKIDFLSLKRELDQFKNDWVDYLPQEFAPNHFQKNIRSDGKRKSLAVTNLPGKKHNESPSAFEASIKAKRAILESEFNYRTAVYDKCPSIRGIIDLFDTVGRSFIVRLDVGGMFPPHRDYVHIPRDSFRVVVFINNCGPYEYDWIMGERDKATVELGRAYFVNTTKIHRIVSWTNNSIKLIMNVPYTNENINILLKNLQHKT